MTKDNIASHIHAVLSEFTDGYVILGRSAADGSTIARCWCPDETTRAKLNEMVLRVCGQGGLPVPQDDEGEMLDRERALIGN